MAMYVLSIFSLFIFVTHIDLDESDKIHMKARYLSFEFTRWQLPIWPRLDGGRHWQAGDADHEDTRTDRFKVKPAVALHGLVV